MKKLLNGTILLLLMCAVSGLTSCMNDGGSDWVGSCVNISIPTVKCRKWTASFMAFKKVAFWHIV